MLWKIKTALTVIACASVLGTGGCVGGGRAAAEDALLRRQYPENRSENPPALPENDIGGPRIKALSSLNTVRTKEGWRSATPAPKNIKLHHKGLHAAKMPNGTFYKIERRLLENALSRSDVRDATVPHTEETKNCTAILTCTHLSSCQPYKNNANSMDASLEKCGRAAPPQKQAPRRSREIRFTNASEVSARRNSKLEFPDVPAGDDMRVPALQLEKEYFLFRPFTKLMGYLQPPSFPTGFIRDALQSQVPTHILVVKALKTEATVLGWIFLWLVLALALPCAVAARYCCTSSDMQRLYNENSLNSSEASSRRWMGIAVALLMHLMLLALLSCIVLMFAANEQTARSSKLIPNATDVILHDIETFVENSNMQMAAISSSSMRLAIDESHRILEGAEELLGNPLQGALDAETGLGPGLLALADLAKASAELSARVSDLLRDCDEARKVAQGLQGSLMELSRLLTLARQECLPRDQALCDTLQTSGLNVSLRTDQLASDENLRQLRDFGEKEDFNRTVELARRMFEGLPRRVSLETAISRAGLRSVLNKRRGELYDAVRSLEETSGSIKGKLSSARSGVLKEIQTAVARDLWRWLSVLGLSLLIFFVWGFLVCGAPCGCRPASRMTLFLLTGLGLTCALSLILWAFGAAAFILGSHGEALICQPLYDQPKYTVFADLLNADGILYRDGLFGQIFRRNISLRVEDALSNCQQNLPAYKSFNMQSFFNLTVLTDPREWHDFQALYKKFSVDLSNFDILTPAFEEQLAELSLAARLNLTKYRTELSGLVTGRDLNSLTEQLRSVAKQLSELRDAQRLENLAAQTREVANVEVQALKKLQDRILYGMAAVEVLDAPFSNKVDRCLSHVKAAQFVIKSRGSWIVRRTVENYLVGIKVYLMQMNNYVTGRMNKDIAKCQPLWGAFDAARTIICKMLVDPINGFCFACFSCVLLFLGLAPVIIRTVARYKETTEDTFSSITHRRARNELIINDEGTWATPSLPGSSEEGARPAEPSVWTTPRSPSEPSIPSPPRFPELPSAELPIGKPERLLSSKPRILDPVRLIQLASRIQDPPRTMRSPIPRFLQPGTSKAAKDRYEALKLIERIDRRTPRSWL